WYKGDTLITTEPTLTAELAHANLNVLDLVPVISGWYADTEYVAKFVPANTDRNTYIVKHFFQQEDGEYVERVDFREEREGIAGQSVSANPKFIAGYKLYPGHPDAVPTGIVQADNSLELCPTNRHLHPPHPPNRPMACV
ncbi:MAG: hypothetical protein IKM54_01355, partial [Butyricicoccus sp.]|nr:hypothetical protein [Butyricicoccus sp.]